MPRQARNPTGGRALTLLQTTIWENSQGRPASPACAPSPRTCSQKGLATPHPSPRPPPHLQHRAWRGRGGWEGRKWTTVIKGPQMSASAYVSGLLGPPPPLQATLGPSPALLSPALTRPLGSHAAPPAARASPSEPRHPSTSPPPLARSLLRAPTCPSAAAL